MMDTTLFYFVARIFSSVDEWMLSADQRDLLHQQDKNKTCNVRLIDCVVEQEECVGERFVNGGELKKV